MKEDEMGWTYSTLGTNQKCMENFTWKTWKEEMG
jgi:hypothetical protein